MIEANLEALKRRRLFRVISIDGTSKPVSQSAISKNTLRLVDEGHRVFPAEYFLAPTYAPPKEPA